jgi:hypothetical protein
MLYCCTYLIFAKSKNFRRKSIFAKSEIFAFSWAKHENDFCSYFRENFAKIYFRPNSSGNQMYIYWGHICAVQGARVNILGVRPGANQPNWVGTCLGTRARSKSHVLQDDGHYCPYLLQSLQPQECSLFIYPITNSPVLTSHYPG